MNIGLLIPTINKGGAERAATRISKILSKKHNVYMIVFSQEEAPAYDYEGTFIDMRCPPKKGAINKLLISLKRKRILSKIKKKYKLDIVISFMKSPNFVNAMSKVKKCRCFVSVRNYLFEEKKLGFFDKIQFLSLGMTFKKADKIISVSKEISESIKLKYNKIKKLDGKLEVLYNPYDFSEIEYLCNCDYELPDNFKNKFVFCTMGRIQHQKGFWNLIKSFYLFHKRHNDSKLIIIGEDFSNGRIINLIDKLSLSNDVLLVGKQENPFCIIAKTQCYILSSLFEGFPNSLVEAMACGTPVIAANCKSGPKEILDDNVNLKIEGIYEAKYGLIYRCFSNFEEDYSSKILNEHQILADAMEKIYLNDRVRYRYSNLGIERVKAFSYEEFDKQIHEIIMREEIV